MSKKIIGRIGGISVFLNADPDQLKGGKKGNVELVCINRSIVPTDLQLTDFGSMDRQIATVENDPQNINWSISCRSFKRGAPPITQKHGLGEWKAHRVGYTQLFASFKVSFVGIVHHRPLVPRPTVEVEVIK